MQNTANAVNEIIILTSSFITRLNSLKYCINVGILFLILAAATPINNENISKWIMLPSVSDLKILLGKNSLRGLDYLSIFCHPYHLIILVHNL